MKKEDKIDLYFFHPINERRNEVGTFYQLLEQLRQDDTKFFNYFRMSITSFDELHGRIKDSIQRSSLFFIQFIKFATQAQANFTSSVSFGISVLEYFEGFILQDRSLFD
nr:unnamed protein product [Callosobruchus chinensis]